MAPIILADFWPLQLFTDAGQYFVRFGDMSRRGEAIHSGDLSSGPLQEGTTMETHHKLQAIAQATENVRDSSST